MAHVRSLLFWAAWNPTITRRYQARVLQFMPTNDINRLNVEAKMKTQVPEAHLKPLLKVGEPLKHQIAARYTVQTGKWSPFGQPVDSICIQREPLEPSAGHTTVLGADATTPPPSALDSEPASADRVARAKLWLREHSTYPEEACVEHIIKNCGLPKPKRVYTFDMLKNHINTLFTKRSVKQQLDPGTKAQQEHDAELKKIGDALDIIEEFEQYLAPADDAITLFTAAAKPVAHPPDARFATLSEAKGEAKLAYFGVSEVDAHTAITAIENLHQARAHPKIAPIMQAAKAVKDAHDRLDRNAAIAAGNKAVR